jgi:hypothetical protein
MNLAPQKISEMCKEQELSRVLGDQMSRMSMNWTSGNRIQKMQDLLSKVSTLGETDFEVAFRAMEGVLQSTLVRNGESQKNKSKSEKAQELKKEVSEITKR